jgi:hypothetical protein
METSVATARSSAQIDLTAEVSQYFEALRREQARFLDAVGQATSALGQQTGHVAHLSAIQGRLTRQFFDAQRLILQRRAETDAEVARIAAETEDHANVVLASAVAHAAADQFAPLSAGGPSEDLAVPADPTAIVAESTRQAIAALGVLAMRTKADADALEHVINDALAPTEPDGARMERQLQQLLDDWWASEAQEGRALLDDARARAAMRLHLAHIEACEIVTAAAPSQEPALLQAPPSLLPASVTEVLDRGDVDSLEGLFATLEQTLVAGASVPVVASTVGPSFLPAVRPAAELEPVSSTDHFQHFWQQEEAATTDERSLSIMAILRRIVFPMFAVTSALALALAWIG